MVSLPPPQALKIIKAVLAIANRNGLNVWCLKPVKSLNLAKSEKGVLSMFFKIN